MTCADLRRALGLGKKDKAMKVRPILEALRKTRENSARLKTLQESRETYEEMIDNLVREREEVVQEEVRLLEEMVELWETVGDTVGDEVDQAVEGVLEEIVQAAARLTGTGTTSETEEQ